MKTKMAKKTIPALFIGLQLMVQPTFAQGKSWKDIAKDIGSSLMSAAKSSSQNSTKAHTNSFDVGQVNIKTPHDILVSAISNTMTQNTGDSVGYRTQVVVDPNQKEPALIDFKITDQYIQITVRVSEEAQKNPALWMAEAAILKNTQRRMYGVEFQTEDTSTFLNQNGKIATLMELITNAQAGSAVSQARLMELKLEALRNLTLRGSLKPLESEVAQQIVQLETALPEVVAKATKYQRAQEKALNNWRKETGTLEKYEAMETKLNDLVLANDRTGVRKMLEAYLPWAVMEPVEVQTWKNWLDAIENPDKEKTVIAFRGLNYKTDKLQRTADGKIGMLSTVLTANQGSYTRRLRSLSTNRVLNGDHTASMIERKAWPSNTEAPQSGNLVASRIQEQFRSHSSDPKASSFLSFTYNPSVASRFSEGGEMVTDKNGKTFEKMKGGVVAVKVDARRMIPNLISTYTGEIELLAPLIIFPDEVIAFEEGREAKSSNYAKLLDQVKESTGNDYRKWQSVKDGDMALHQKFMADGFEFMKKSIDQTLTAGKTCSSLFI